VNQKEMVTLFYNRWNYFFKEQKVELSRLNKELQKQKETLEHITDTIGEGLYVMNEAGMITHVNESMVKILGYLKVELLGRIAHEMFHAHYHNAGMPIEQCPIYRTIQSRRAYEGVEEFVRKDGSFCQVRVTSHPLLEKGNVTGSVTTFADIGDELRMQEQVRQSEAWFRGLFDFSPDGIVIVNPRTMAFTDFNAAAHNNMGYTREEFARLTINDLDVIESPDETRKRVRQIEERGRSDFETLHRAKDGSLKSVSVSVLKVERPDGVYLMSIYRDITESKRAEAELKEHEIMLRTIYDVLPVGITISDPEGNIIGCNAASEKLIGISKSEHLSRAVDGKEWRIFRPDGTVMPRSEYPSVRAMKEGSIIRDVEMGIEKPEGVIWLSVSAMPAGDSRYGVVVAYADVTRRRESEVRLRSLSEQLAEQVEHEVAARMKAEGEKKVKEELLIQQSRMAELGSMVGAIAHQWKQPLNTIGLIAQDMADAYAHKEMDAAMMEEDVEKVMEQVYFMGETIDDFRNFFKPSIEMRRFSLQKSVDATIRLLKIQLDKNGIKVAIGGDDRVQVIGYENELKQVILNIINNAKDAFLERRGADPRIEFTISKNDTQAVLVIGDNAGGIAPELLPDKLFEPFHSTKGEKGTGIGLSLARQIMEKMNGTITARNSENGAIFEITLPALEDGS